MVTKIEKNRVLILLLVSVVFILFRYEDAKLPFFWDELHAYVKGTLYMVDNQISLSPSAVPDYISFGHPLLLFFLQALWCKVFGISPLAFHSFSVLLALFTAIGTYLLSVEITKSKVVSMVAFCLFLIQPIVVAQSTQVVLEMLLTCTVVYAIYFFVKNNYTYAALFSTLAVLTKETGLVLAITFPIVLFLQLIKSKRWIETCKQGWVLILPFLVFSLFLLLQKQANGWFFNPNNLGATKFSFSSITQRAWDYSIKLVWFEQGRFFLTIFSLIVITLTLVKSKNKTLKLSQTVLTFVVFGFVFMLFSAINSSLDRYFLVMIPLVCAIYALGVLYASRLNKTISIAAVCIGVCFAVFNLNNKNKNKEIDLSYRNQPKTFLQLFQFLNQPQFADKTIMLDFPLYEATQDSRYGYMNNPVFHPVWIKDTIPGEYIVYTKPGNLTNPSDTTELELVQQFNTGSVYAFLFKKK